MNKNTISLLKACNEGCKYATNSMEKLYPHIKDSSLKQVIDDYNGKHIKIGDSCHELLNKYNANEEDPKAISSIFANLSIDVKMLADSSNQKIAEIMFDGCHMGIKSVGQYLNKYPDAAPESKKLAKELINVEQNYMNDLLGYI